MAQFRGAFDLRALCRLRTTVWFSTRANARTPSRQPVPSYLLPPIGDKFTVWQQSAIYGTNFPRCAAKALLIDEIIRNSSQIPAIASG